MSPSMKTTDVTGLRDLADTARRIDALTDELRRRTQALDGSPHGDELAVLAGALTRVTKKLVARCAELGVDRTAAPPPAAPEQPAPAPEPAPAPALGVRAGTPPRRPRSGLAIVATELAVAGASRTEIESYLRERYGIQDASDILDEVFDE
jgi:hypothetical protein